LITSVLAVSPVMAQRGRWRGSTRGIESHESLARNDAEKRILDTIRAVVENHRTYSSVPAADGRMLRILTEAANAQHVVEVGTSTGYSGLWICLALEGTGGKLTTFEYDSRRAEMAREHFRQAGVEDRVTLIEGDAHVNVSQLEGPIDVVFIDADKNGYTDYLEKLLPLVRPGGLLLAHNVGMPGVDTYARAVAENPDLETTFYMDGGGLAITVKKR
jgi:predicted O-methyltransferase YrrM